MLKGHAWYFCLDLIIFDCYSEIKSFEWEESFWWCSHWTFSFKYFTLSTWKITPELSSCLWPLRASNGLTLTEWYSNINVFRRILHHTEDKDLAMILSWLFLSYLASVMTSVVDCRGKKCNSLKYIWLKSVLFLFSLKFSLLIPFNYYAIQWVRFEDRLPHA